MLVVAIQLISLGRNRPIKSAVYMLLSHFLFTILGGAYLKASGPPNFP